jgi:hypothetical protein
MQMKPEQYEPILFFAIYILAIALAYSPLATKFLVWITRL